MVLSWGKPDLYVRLLGNNAAVWRKLSTPKEDSTQLTTSEGDKNEAKAEGGSLVDVKYKKSSFELAADFFIRKGEKKQFGEKDGLVAGNYEIYVVPAEDEEAYGMYMPKVAVSVTTNYTAADGFTQNIKFSAIEKDNNTEQMQLGVVEVVKTGNDVSFNFTPIEAESEFGDDSTSASTPTA